MLTVACYLWGNKYNADDARNLQRMVQRNLTVPHEFACITDRPEQFDRDPDIRGVQMDMSVHIPGRIFATLGLFGPDARDAIGDRVLKMDLDALVVGNMDHIVDREEELVLWRNPSRVPWETPIKNRPLYNGSMVLHKTGTMTHLWESFDPNRPMVRDDQAWISMQVGFDCPYWDGENDGVYRIERDDTPGSGVGSVLPENAAVIFFVGSEGKIDNPRIRAKCPWIEDVLCSTT